MNRFFSLPQHILSNIYEFDNTYRLVFDVCCRDVWAKSYDVFMRYILFHTHYKRQVLNDTEQALKEVFDVIRCNKIYPYKPPVDEIKIWIRCKDPELTSIFWDGKCIRKLNSYSYCNFLQISVNIYYDVKTTVKIEWHKCYY